MQRYLPLRDHLYCTICPHEAVHIPLTFCSHAESSAQTPLRMKRLNSASLNGTLLSNYFISTAQSCYCPETGRIRITISFPNASPFSLNTKTKTIVRVQQTHVTEKGYYTGHLIHQKDQQGLRKRWWDKIVSWAKFKP